MILDHPALPDSSSSFSFPIPWGDSIAIDAWRFLIRLIEVSREKGYVQDTKKKENAVGEEDRNAEEDQTVKSIR